MRRLKTDPVEEKALLARDVEAHVLLAFRAGDIEVPILETFPLQQANQAYERFTAGGKLGRIVLTVVNSDTRPWAV